jgi:pilus assembly protein Flp/PilA
MQKLMAKSRRLLAGEAGPTAVEYAVMLAMIILVCFAVVRTLGLTVGGLLNSANTSFGAGS